MTSCVESLSFQKFTYHVVISGGGARKKPRDAKAMSGSHDMVSNKRLRSVS